MSLSQNELSQMLNEAASLVSIGETYVHYKDSTKKYIVTDIVIDEATELPLVIYRAQYGNNITYARAVSSWTEVLELDEKTVSRFTLTSA